MHLDNSISFEQEKRLISILFITFGVGIMSWIPRFPDLKAHLGVSNGQFGSMLSFGAFGAIASLLTVGHFVHRFGSKAMFLLTNTLLYGTFIAIVHLKSPYAFTLLNIFLGFSISAVHITCNGQAFHSQERQGRMLIPRWHGMWSAGATIGAFAGIFLVGTVDFRVHITSVAIAVYLINLYAIIKLGNAHVAPGEGKDSIISIKKIFTGFHFDWLVSAGMSSSIALEIAAGDWATIYTKESIGIKSGLSVLPYLLFMLMMIVGRLRVAKAAEKYTMPVIVKRGSLYGALGFSLFFFIGAALSPDQKWLAFALTCIAFTIAGLGSSFLGPSFFNVANDRSPNPGAVVAGQLGVQNQMILFFVKLSIAWTAQFTNSLAIGLIIPVVLLSSVGFYAKAFKKA